MLASSSQLAPTIHFEMCFLSSWARSFGDELISARATKPSRDHHFRKTWYKYYLRSLLFVAMIDRLVYNCSSVVLTIQPLPHVTLQTCFRCFFETVSFKKAEVMMLYFHCFIASSSSNLIYCHCFSSCCCCFLSTYTSWKLAMFTLEQILKSWHANFGLKWNRNRFDTATRKEKSRKFAFIHSSKFLNLYI